MHISFCPTLLVKSRAHVASARAVPSTLSHPPVPTYPLAPSLSNLFPRKRFPQEHDLELLVSTVRLIHRTLSISPAAAAAVAAGGVPPRDLLNGTATSPRPMSLATAIESAAVPPPPAAAAAPGGGTDSSATGGKGKGKKRRRSGSGNGDGDDDVGPADRRVPHAAREADRNGDKSVGDNGDDSVGGSCTSSAATATGDRRPMKRSRHQQAPSRTIFIAGEPVPSGDLPEAVANPAGVSYAPSASKAAIIGGPASIDGRKDRLSWAGRKGEAELGARLKGHLVSVFHRGVYCGCPPLVEACLRVRRAE